MHEEGGWGQLELVAHNLALLFCMRFYQMLLTYTTSEQHERHSNIVLGSSIWGIRTSSALSIPAKKKVNFWVCHYGTEKMLKNPLLKYTHHVMSVRMPHK